ncbi:MAG: hypothetical protein D6806_09765 [Deltaproteobacteria bacterium]|nr:MAG: hypothetical protein D6806_09765 [Deltaproteobacteria bacterium]
MHSRRLPAAAAALALVLLAFCTPRREVESLHEHLKPAPGLPRQQLEPMDTFTLLDPSAIERREVTDIEALKKTGSIRVAYLAEPGKIVLPQRHPLPRWLKLSEYLAEYLQVQLEPVAVNDPSALGRLLDDGVVEIVGTPVFCDENTKERCSTTVEQVEAVVAARAGDPLAPKTIGELNGAALSGCRLPLWITLADEGLARFGLEHCKLKLENGASCEQVLARVGAGELPLVLVRSDTLEGYRTLRDDVEPLFVVEKQLPLSWMVSARVAGLQEAVNGFLYEWSMTTHKRRRMTGDLDEIRRYGGLRVAMLNNPVAYFIYRGQEVGFQYELAELLAARLGLRLEVVVPETPADTARLVAEGYADVAFLSPNPSDPYQGELVWSEPVHHSDQVVVQRSSEHPITGIHQLAGRTILVRRSSQYWPAALALELSVPWLELVAADERLETEDLIDLVGKGEIDLTIANSVLLDTLLQDRDDVGKSIVVVENQPLVFGVRRASPRLFRRVQRFVAKDCRGKWYKSLMDKYFAPRPRIRQVRADSLSQSGEISPYDELVKKVASEHGMDWRLLLAIIYKESRFDPKSVSWSGAVGLMQVMPRTAREMGYDPGRLFEPEQNIRAGVEYLTRLFDSFEPSLPRRQRLRFAIAAYNAGIGHVRDARRLAWRLGLDPNRWFGHVERAMLLLEKPAYYERARYGYCRGSETVQYVSEIQGKYEAYSRLAPAASVPQK